jgi:hypothetical protein
VDGRPVAVRAVRPGSRVTIVNGTPVVYQNGQYVVVQSPPATGAVAPGGVLTSPPACGGDVAATEHRGRHGTRDRRGARDAADDRSRDGRGSQGDQGQAR